MNKKYILLPIFLLFIANTVLAADYYPEMGMDPFYSSINPMYVNNEVMPENQDSIIDLIKKKKNKKKNEEYINEVEEKIEPAVAIEEVKKTENGKEKNIVEPSDDKFVSKPQKGLTKAELEKELRAEEKEKQKALKNAEKVESKTSLKEKLFFFKNKKKEEVITKEDDSNIELTADYMEYFPERYEVEAVNNAKVVLKAQDLTLSADKIIFNYDRNILKASKNVVLKTKESVTEGDFIKIDLSQPSGWIENPLTKTEDIKLTAKEAYIYSDRIEENDGVAKILKDEVLSIGAKSFAAYVDRGGLFSQNVKNIDNSSKGVYKLKAESIIIDSLDEHEVVTIKNADVYLKNRKLATVPSLKIVTNKQHASAEANFPEFGSQSMLGMHAGPAVVLNVPGGSTLKLAPIISYDDKWGFGGIARFRNQFNMTEMAYATSNDELLIRGRHKLAPGLMLNYSRLTNQNEWFLGFRRPKYSTHLDYSRTDKVKDLKLIFTQMYSAGIYIDEGKSFDWNNAEGRFRWMTQTTKPIYKYENQDGSIGFNLGLVAQTSATVYTSGETTGLFRFGPAISSKVGPWNQSIVYFQTAQAGETPFMFDRYRYGRSNVILIESLKLSKYLTAGFLGSLAMNSDIEEDQLFQESRIFLSIGPEYARLSIGYDAYRKNTMFILSMLVGTKDSDITFKKTILKNPEKVGKEKSKKKKAKKKNYKKYLKPEQDV